MYFTHVCSPDKGCFAIAKGTSVYWPGVGIMRPKMVEKLSHESMLVPGIEESGVDIHLPFCRLYDYTLGMYVRRDVRHERVFLPA